MDLLNPYDFERCHLYLRELRNLEITMARPTLDDDRYLLEVAIVLCSNEGMKFAHAFRVAKPRMGAINNLQSDDSFRHRLQGKWRKDPAYWRERAFAEIKERRHQQIEQGIENIHRFAAGISGNMALLGQGIQRALSSPAMQAMLENMDRLQKQISVAHMPSMEMLERVNKQHEAILRAVPKRMR